MSRGRDTGETSTIASTVAIGIAVLLIGTALCWLLRPVFWGHSTGHHHGNESGSNMRVIVSMMIAYQYDSGLSLNEVLPFEDEIDPWTACRHTARLFAVLSAAYQEDLPEKIFRQPCSEPSTLTMPGVPDVFAYAFDWAAPGKAGANRVLMAERPPLRSPGTIVVLVSGDGHISKLACTELTPGSFDPTRRTLGRDGRPVAIQVLTPDGDDIFERGDGGADDVWVR